MQITAEDMRLFDRHPLFSGVRAEARRQLVSDAIVRQFERGKILFHQGDPADRFFVVASGWVKLYRLSSAGEEVILHVFSAGESFADAAIFGAGTYPVTAEVIEAARLIEIPAQPFLQRLHDDPELAFNMLASLSAHMRALVEQVEQRSGRSAETRVGTFLLRLCHGHGGDARVRLPYEKFLVAARLGMRAETFSRSLARLRKIGVRVDGHDVIVPDVAKRRALITDD